MVTETAVPTTPALRKGSKVCLTFATPSDLRTFNHFVLGRFAEAVPNGYHITNSARFADFLGTFDNVKVEKI